MTMWHMKIPPRPWAEVVEHYERMPHYAPMLELVQQIRSCSSGFVACTSVMELRIAQSEANFFVGPELRIGFDSARQEFRFSYLESLLGHAGKRKAPLWIRTAPTNEGFEVLERFLLKRARWFHKPVDASTNSPSPYFG